MNGTKLWVLSIVLIVATAATIKFSSILPLFAVSAIIAYLLRPLAEWLIRKFRLKRGFAVAVVFLLFIAFVSIVVVALVPVVTSQITSLANDAESITAGIQTFADQALALLEDWKLPPPHWLMSTSLSIRSTAFSSPSSSGLSKRFSPIR